jgi:hypothetical protein
MPVSRTTTTTFICDLCMNSLVHSTGSLSALVHEFLFSNRWIVLEHEGTTTVICPSCRVAFRDIVTALILQNSETSPTASPTAMPTGTAVAI